MVKLSWNARHPERLKAMQRKHYLAKRDLIKARSKKWAEANRERRRQIMLKWYALNPDRAKENGDKWRADNRERINEQAKERRKKYYQENPEKFKTRQRAYAQKNPETIKRLWRDWRSNNPAKALAAQQRYKARMKIATTEDCTERIEELLTCELCFWCKGKMRTVTIDHIVPLSRGGEHHPENLVASCKPCNSSKGTNLVSEWKQLKEAI